MYYDEESCRRSVVHYEVTNYSDGSCNVHISLERLTAEQAEKLLINVIEKFGSETHKKSDLKDSRFKIDRAMLEME